MSSSCWMACADCAEIGERVMPSSHLHQSVEQFLHRRQHARIRGVGILQGQQVAHFLVDIDACAVVETLLQGRQDDVLALDRKSTRLNSSHGYISYAVFCLK